MEHLRFIYGSFTDLEMPLQHKRRIPWVNKIIPNYYEYEDLGCADIGSAL